MRQIIGWVTLLCLLTRAQAQTPMTLEQSLKLAVENNVQVKLRQNGVESAELSLVQKKFDFLPGVTASLPANKSFGNSADIFTQQIAVSPWTSQPSISASVVAFRGLAKWNDLKQAEYNLVASQYTLEDLKNDIRLSTALAFFQCIFASDNVSIANSRIALLEQQQEKLEHQIAAGTKTEGDRFTLQAQLATERVNVVTQQNLYDRSLLDLILLLNLNPSEDYVLARPAILDSMEAPLEPIEAIYNAARLNNPAVLKQEFKALATKYAINSARAAYFPTVNMSFGLTSFYSSNSRERIGFTVVDGFPEILYGQTIPMFTQFESNFSQTLVLSMNVPIFNRLSTRQNYLLSKVNYNSALLTLEAEQMELYKAIQQAHLDATAAEAKFAATEEQLRSLAESYRYAEARYNAGMLDHYAFMEVLNSKTKAEIEQLQARYDRMLKRKILDIYQGKPLQF
jgi:outer membrane protein